MRRFYNDKLSLRVHSAWEVTWSLTCQMFIWGLATDVSGKMCWAHCESSCQGHERGVDIHTGMCSTLIHVNCFPAVYMGWVSWPHFMGSLCLLSVLRQGGECSFSKAGPFDHQRSCPWCFVCHYCKSLCWACVHSFADVVIFGHFAGRWYCCLTLSLILFCSLCFWCCIWCSISQNLGLLLWIG